MPAAEVAEPLAAFRPARRVSNTPAAVTTYRDGLRLIFFGGRDMSLKGCARRAGTVVRLRSDLLNSRSDIPRVLVEVSDRLSPGQPAATETKSLNARLHA